MNAPLRLEHNFVLEDHQIFGAAILSPANSCDLSTWHLTIDRDGLLAQTVRVRQPPYRGEQTVTLHQHIAESDIRKLYEVASDIRFRQLKNRYSPADIECACCGEGTTVLKARLHNEITSVEFDSVDFMVEKGFDAAMRYHKMWNAITSHAPFVPYVDKR